MTPLWVKLQLVASRLLMQNEKGHHQIKLGFDLLTAAQGARITPFY